jgi:hypothetical protein
VTRWRQQPQSSARVGVAGGDLDISQVDASVEHGRDECVTEHVRVCLGHLYAGSIREVPQAAGSRVTVHPGAAAIEQDGPARADSGSPVNGPPYCWRQRDQDDLGALAAHAQHPVAMFLAEVTDVGASSFEDPQPSSPSMATSAKS